MQLVVAEKPSVARDIARVLGVPARGEGCFRGGDWIITWCIGHLVELEEPASYDPAWKSWRLSLLPMIPATFKLRPARSSAGQWKHVRSLLRAREVTSVINACDAGREGELIFRYCYELAGSKLPMRRLWISSMTDAALRAGFASLKPGAQYDALAAAARCRSEADWLVGMNATRAVTSRFRQGGASTLFSIGRVQTPTLALVVAREQAIRAFVPRDYWEVNGTFAPEGSEHTFRAGWERIGQRRLASRALAEQLVERAEEAAAKGASPPAPRVESIEHKQQKEPPPLLFDLTSLQRTANRRFGMSAQRTLDVAQALYEQHKLLTYPRTDSRFLSTDLRGELPNIFQALRGSAPHAAFAARLVNDPPGAPGRVFNNARVSDHHAIIPTAHAPAKARLDRDEARIYDLVVRRFLGAFYPDAEFALTTAVIVVGPDATPPKQPREVDREALLDALPEPPDRFVARGRVRLVAGWQEVAGIGERDSSGEEGDEEQPLPPLVRGQRLSGRFAHVQKRTQPPRRYNEATLLSAMEYAGREIEDETLRQAMRDTGLGTPATRASTIETLLKRGYLERDAKNLVPTELGVALIEGLPEPSLASPELTGTWEARLARMARGDEERAKFMQDIEGYVRGIVERIKSSAPGEGPVVAAVAKVSSPPIGACPLCKGEVFEQFKYFACAKCDFKLWKQVAGKKVSSALAQVLLARGRTKLLPGFRSKAGKPFSAALVLDETGAVRLSFDEGLSERNPSDGARGWPQTAVTVRKGGRVVRSTKRRAEAASPRPTPAPPQTPASAPPQASSKQRGEGEHPLGGVELLCPRCGEGEIIKGKRAWGCARWREGCTLVIPFVAFGKTITDAQLRDLITRGHTRLATWSVDGEPRKGRLQLDVGSEPPALSISS